MPIIYVIANPNIAIPKFKIPTLSPEQEFQRTLARSIKKVLIERQREFGLDPGTREEFCLVRYDSGSEYDENSADVQIELTLTERSLTEEQRRRIRNWLVTSITRVYDQYGSSVTDEIRSIDFDTNFGYGALLRQEPVLESLVATVVWGEPISTECEEEWG